MVTKNIESLEIQFEFSKKNCAEEKMLRELEFLLYSTFLRKRTIGFWFTLI